MVFQNIYTISKWTDWSHNLANSINDFHNKFSFYPNILEANSYTHSQIDFLTNVDSEERKKVVRKNEELDMDVLPSEEDVINLSVFQVNKCSLDFAVNEELNDKELQLIYDSEPDWDDDATLMDPPIDVLENIKS